MPIALDPQQTFTVVLLTDRGKQPEPCFHFRHPTYREQKFLRELAENLTLAKADKDLPPTFMDDVICAIRRLLTGWDIVDMPYSNEGIDALLTTTELIEVLFQLCYGGITPDDKKKLELQPPINMGNSINGMGPVLTVPNVMEKDVDIVTKEAGN